MVVWSPPHRGLVAPPGCKVWESFGTLKKKQRSHKPTEIVPASAVERQKAVVNQVLNNSSGTRIGGVKPYFLGVRLKYLS